MSVASELLQAGFKGLSKTAINFIEKSVPKTDHAGIIQAVVRHPNELIDYGKHIDNFVKKKDQSGILPMIQMSDKWNNEVVDASLQADTLAHGTNRGTKQNNLYKYEPFEVDQTLSLDEQKRVYKKSASDFIFDAETKAGKTVPVSEFHKKYGKLRVEGEGELDLKFKTKDAQGKKDFQPKLKKTTAKETSKRKGRESPWNTQRDEIKSILAEIGEEDKLAKLLKLIRTQYNNKKKAIKASGLSKGHQKALDNGGLDVPENIIGEQGVSTKEVRGNFARQAKSDLPDPELLKQGAFVGTLKEYILMKLKEVE